MDPLRTALAGSALCAVLLGVYGMRYEYQTVQLQDGGEVAVRTNRYTGETERLVNGVWRKPVKASAVDYNDPRLPYCTPEEMKNPMMVGLACRVPPSPATAPAK